MILYGIRAFSKSNFSTGVYDNKFFFRSMKRYLSCNIFINFVVHKKVNVAFGTNMHYNNYYDYILYVHQVSHHILCQTDVIYLKYIQQKPPKSPLNSQGFCGKETTFLQFCICRKTQGAWGQISPLTILLILISPLKI